LHERSGIGVSRGLEQIPLIDEVAPKSGSSTMTPLLAWVQRPVFVQLVLPDRTRCGLPDESQATTNLLWAK
jgi:hypothetical protein